MYYPSCDLDPPRRRLVSPPRAQWLGFCFPTETQKQGFIRLGVLGDWDNPYLTMNPETEADIVRALGRIASNGHLVKGYKPVYWSVVGASALAEAEVEYQDKQSFAIDVRFAAADRDDVLAGFGQPAAAQALPVSVVIWTTTPWTLPSNQAVCLHGSNLR